MRYAYTLALVLLILLACEDEKRPNINVGQSYYNVPSFNADSSYRYIEKQLSFGPRVPGEPGHAACAEWLKNKLTDFGLEAHIEEFSAKRYDGLAMDGKNIVASLNPGARKRVFVSAHWDTRFKADHDESDKEKAIPGADDGASGVAVALEVARALSNTGDFNMGLDIILFDAEDQGNDNGDVKSWGIGAQRWSNRNKSTYDPAYGILLDMVGARGARFYQEGYSLQSAPQVVYKIWKVAEDLGYGHMFVGQKGRAVVDDHYFINQNTGWPVADIIHTKQSGKTGFGEHWHTHGDDIDVIDRNTLKAVGRVVLHVLCYEDQGRF